jgi:nucleoside-diphosphate-sugar epimerase
MGKRARTMEGVVAPMRILITGNLGYVGPLVVRHLRATMPDAELIGYDTAFFAHCLTGAHDFPDRGIDTQHLGDMRDLPASLLSGVDAIVHLAAVSNDPMGNRFEAVTGDINAAASLRLAELASAARVRAFVLASSCSIYGFAEGGPRGEGDPLNPLTAYARSKVATEQGLRAMDAISMTTTCLRFATACGMSPRLRLDLVLNDFVACAVTSGEITILSDGTPWRPLIDVQDMARAIAWAITRPTANGGHFLAVNVGRDDWNYQIKDLAQAVAAAVPDTKVSINKDALPDKRSYKVDFSLFRRLAPEHMPQLSLEQSITGLRDGLTAMCFGDRNFRNSQYMRLKMLERHLAAGRLSPELRWQWN